MLRGIIESGAFILFLSAGILTRPVRVVQWCRLAGSVAYETTAVRIFAQFCQFEIRQAIKHKKPLVLIRELIGSPVRSSPRAKPWPGTPLIFPVSIQTSRTPATARTTSTPSKWLRRTTSST